MNEKIYKIEKLIIAEIEIEYYQIEKIKIEEIIRHELSLAQLNLSEIYNFIQKNHDVLERYFKNYFECSNTKIIGSGFLVTHSIFLLKLLNSNLTLKTYLLRSNNKKQTKLIFNCVQQSWEKSIKK